MSYTNFKLKNTATSLALVCCSAFAITSAIAAGIGEDMPGLGDDEAPVATTAEAVVYTEEDKLSGRAAAQRIGGGNVHDSSTIHVIGGDQAALHRIAAHDAARLGTRNILNNANELKIIPSSEAALGSSKNPPSAKVVSAVPHRSPVKATQSQEEDSEATTTQTS